MSVQLSPRRIRLALNWRNFYTPLVDAITGAAPRLPRGNPVDVEVAFFDGAPAAGTIVDTLTNIVSTTLEIHAQRSSSAGAMASSTVLNAALTACTWSAWEAGTGYHAKFALTDTNFDLTGQSNGERSLWLVVSASLTGPKELTFGGAALTVWEDSAQLGLPVVGTTNPNWAVGTNGVLYLKDVATGGMRKLWFENGVLKCGPEETP
jgi:hypothetical protein